MVAWLLFWEVFRHHRSSKQSQPRHRELYYSGQLSARYPVGRVAFLGMVWLPPSREVVDFLKGPLECSLKSSGVSTYLRFANKVGPVGRSSWIASLG